MVTIRLLRIALAATVLIGFVRPDWSIMTNSWSASAFMLILFLLVIEEGLRFWRVRMEALHDTLRNNPYSHATTEQDNHYIPKN